MIRLPKMDIGFLSVLVLIVVILGSMGYDIHTKSQNKKTVRQAAALAERKALTDTVYVKPWLNPVGCGLNHPTLRECDRRYWPGGVYPDESIPGEKFVGIIWDCHEERLDRRFPRKVCYADASDARKKAHPCASADREGRRSPPDKFCPRANTLPPETVP